MESTDKTYRDFLLSYRPILPKFILSSIGLIVSIIIPINAFSGANALSGIMFIVSLVIFAISIIDICTTYENRKQLRLTNMNISEIESKSMSRSEIIEYFKRYTIGIIIIKNELMIHKIGIKPIWDDGFIVDKYFYLDEIRDGRIDRIKYRDFEHFMDVLDQINGHRDAFDVVSIDKIVVPKKKKK